MGTTKGNGWMLHVVTLRPESTRDFASREYSRRLPESTRVAPRSESTRVAWRSLVISEGEADKRKATPAFAGLFFCAFVVSLKQAWGNSLTQKSQRRYAGFSLVRRDRDSNSGTKIIGHSLAGCCITTLPPLQELSAWDSRLRVAGGQK